MTCEAQFFAIALQIIVNRQEAIRQHDTELHHIIEECFSESLELLE